MRLYHGGACPVPQPLPQSPSANRTLDFGSGFYTTTSLDQARRWVSLRLRQGAYQTGTVSAYELDDAALSDSALQVKRFSGATEEWLDFVMANRRDRAFQHQWDIVTGPVANDNVYATINLFETGFLNKQATIAALRTYALVDQVLFHTAVALNRLLYLGTEEVQS